MADAADPEGQTPPGRPGDRAWPLQVQVARRRDALPQPRHRPRLQALAPGREAVL